MDVTELQGLLDSFKTELLSEVDAKNKGLASSISRDIKKLQAKQEPEEQVQPDAQLSASDKLLKQELDELKATLAQEKQQAFESKRDLAIQQAIANSGAINQGFLAKGIKHDYQSQLREEGGKWLIEQDGKVVLLNDLVKNFLSSEEGSVFLPAPQVKGSGSTETKATVAAPVINPNSNSIGAAIAAQITK